MESGRLMGRIQPQRKTAAEAAVLSCRGCEAVQAIGRICVACLPLGPSFTSNSTFWFSLRVLKPEPWISEKWAKRSSPPPSGLMKPKPLESLNHFTVPVLIAFPFERYPGFSPGTRASEQKEPQDGYCRRPYAGTPSHCLPYPFTAWAIIP